MKATEFNAFARKHMMPQLPGFRLKGGLIFVEPIKYLLRGFHFEASGWDRDSFYLWVFVQPLYVLSKHVSFTFGKRLGSSWKRPTRDKEDEIIRQLLTTMKREGVPFLDRLRSPTDLAANAVEVTSAPHNPRVLEAKAYSLVLAGEYREAFDVLARLRHAIEEMDPRRHWRLEIAERAQLVYDALVRNPQEAVALLNEWRDLTVKNLRLVEEKPKKG